MPNTRLHSYQEIVANATTQFRLDQRIHTTLTLRTTDDCPRRIVEREVADFVAGAALADVYCTTVVDPTIKRPEYLVLVFIAGTAAQIIDLGNYMINLKASRAS